MDLKGIKKAHVVKIKYTNGPKYAGGQSLLLPGYAMIGYAPSWTHSGSLSIRSSEPVTWLVQNGIKPNHIVTKFQNK